ncbi:MAG: hypothetical protein D6B26_07190 [Spirochaetaceae bacterium]|nr:MAG: hypothetical protein D6B26_07190 [Spirochaetaceae bacterium]
MKLLSTIPLPRMNLTQMADMAYLLLIFVILLSLSSSVEPNADGLPTVTNSGEKEMATVTLVISEAEVKLGDQVFESLEELGNGLALVAEAQTIALSASGDLAFGRIRKVLAHLEGQGFSNIAFSVRELR